MKATIKQNGRKVSIEHCNLVDENDNFIEYGVTIKASRKNGGKYEMNLTLENYMNLSNLINRVNNNSDFTDVFEKQLSKN